jgi:hypothetical protein
MDTPLTTDSPFGEARQALTGPVEPLPKELRDQIRRYLRQPSSSDSPAAADDEARRLQQARLTGGIAAVWFSCAGTTGYRSFDLACATTSGVAGTFGCILLSVIFFFVNRHLHRDVLPHMLAELESPITPNTAKAMAKTVKGVRWFVLLLCIICIPTSVAFAWNSEADGPACAETDTSEACKQWPDGCEWTRIWNGTNCEPPTSLQWGLRGVAIYTVVMSPTFAIWPMVLVVPQNMVFALAADKVERLAAEIQRATAATADYGAFTTSVFRAHTDTTKLSALMQTQLLGLSALVLPWTVIFMVMALGSRPTQQGGSELCNDAWDPEFWGGFGSWYNLFVGQYIMSALSTSFAALLAYSLLAPARVTSACQKVADAVNELRVTVKADGTAELATADELHRIEGLKRYINELNRDQGLGFVLLRKRITFTFV